MPPHLRRILLDELESVMVEVKARFDEQNNIEWARLLETAGVHVTYGVMGLKTHAKAILIVREEQGHLRTYCHIGTGNYHAGNALVYTDLGLLTSNPAVGEDLVRLFHSVTGYAPGQTYRELIVAPSHMRSAFHRLIQREIEHASAGRTGRVIAKMNALDDPEIIQHLYEASRAGVEVALVVRGHCTLRPAISGFSENIRVVSIIGRFLEHDRIYYFHDDGHPDIYIGSADWRGRNLDDRVEALVPIRELPLQARLVRILELALADSQLAWELQADGRYARRVAAAGERVVNLHEILMGDARPAAPAMPRPGARPPSLERVAPLSIRSTNGGAAAMGVRTDSAEGSVQPV